MSECTSMTDTRIVLVTGGAGYIGSHVCKALAGNGYKPITYDNLSHGHREFVKWGPLEEGDVRDPARLDDVFARWRPEAVLHFAALISVAESVAEPALYQDVNVTGSHCVLDAMNRHGVSRIVFSSTAAVYGTPATLPITESASLAPMNPYGETKLAIEGAIAAALTGERARYAILRYFNAAGADPDGELGESHEPETHLIPNAILAALGRRSALEVFGNDYPTPDGTCIRDYVHVSDVAHAHLMALRHFDQGHESIVCDLGTGQGASVQEVVDVVAAITGRAVPTKTAPRRPGDTPVLYTEGRAARDLLGWHPRRSALASIVKDAVRWHEAQGHR
jgi:UDP-glucose-4-epimerase GalE